MNEGQVGQLHMVKKEEGMEKRQPTGLEPVAFRSIAYLLAAEPWPMPAPINPWPFLPYLLYVGLLYPEYPVSSHTTDKDQICVAYC